MLGDGGSAGGVGGSEVGEGAEDAGGLVTEGGVGRVGVGELAEEWGALLKVRLPEVELGELAGSGRVLLLLGGVGDEGLEGGEFGGELAAAAEGVKELGLEIGGLLPVLAEQVGAGGGVGGGFGAVGGEQVAGEGEVMREAAVRVEVELEVLLRPVGMDVAKVLFELGAVEDVHDLAGEQGEGLAALAAEVEAGELVIKAGGIEAGDGALVDLLLLRVEVVLLEERGNAFVEERVVGVAVELAAEDGKGRGKLAGGGEAAEVAVEHLHVRGSGGGGGRRCDGEGEGLLEEGGGGSGGGIHCGSLRFGALRLRSR